MLFHNYRQAFAGAAEPGDVSPQPDSESQSFSSAHMLLAALPWPGSIGAIEHMAKQAA